MGGNYGRDGEMTEKEEEEKGRSLERSRASTRVDQTNGSVPVFTSITLTAQTYITTPGKKSKMWPPHKNICNSFSRYVRSLITA